jgi:hypothetical protein
VKVLLVPGTWGGRDDWWHPGAPLVQLLEAAGHEVIGPLSTPPWSWPAPLDGLFGANRAWEAAGLSLYWYLEGRPVDALLTHSHGLQPAALALAHGATVDKLVSVAGPVRPELMAVYATAAEQTDWWTQIHTDTWGDWWQGLGTYHLARARRRHYAHPAADANLYEPGRFWWPGHTRLLDADLWRARGWVQQCLDG